MGVRAYILCTCEENHQCTNAGTNIPYAVLYCILQLHVWVAPPLFEAPKILVCLLKPTIGTTSDKPTLHAGERQPVNDVCDGEMSEMK